MTARRLLALVTPRDDTREPRRSALSSEFLTYSFRETDRGDEKRRGAHTARVSATHTPRGAVGRGANRRGSAAKNFRWEPKNGNPSRGERTPRHGGPRIEGGLEPGIAARRVECVLSVAP